MHVFSHPAFAKLSPKIYRAEKELGDIRVLTQTSFRGGAERSERRTRNPVLGHRGLSTHVNVQSVQ